MQVKNLIKHLQDNHKEDDYVAYDLWTVADVLDRAKDTRRQVSKEQAIDIIESINRSLDASIGITWDTIDSAIDFL